MYICMYIYVHTYIHTNLTGDRKQALAQVEILKSQPVIKFTKYNN